MKNKKTAFIILTAFLLSSCAESFDSVKRGITGAKRKSADEFLVKKRDPLIIPPEMREPPKPNTMNKKTKKDENTIKKILKVPEDTNKQKLKSSSVEQSILKELRK